MSLSFAYVQHLVDKSFRKRLVNAAGRNFLGRICVFHQGGGRLTLYRSVDFTRRINNHGRVIRLSKNAYRTATVATLLYLNGVVSSILAVDTLSLGNLVFSGMFVPKKSFDHFNKGSAIPLGLVNVFSAISCAELGPFQGLSLFRAAGVSGLLVAKDKTHGTIKCSSG